MAEITITIPDDLAQRLQQFQVQLPQVLELGLQELQSQQRSSNFLDQQDIITLLASQPTPDQILAIRPSPEFQAGDRCEYCRFPQRVTLLAFEMEHIISEKHGGTTTLENLALACPYCNRAKGTDLGSIDPETKQLTPFFNPRT